MHKGVKHHLETPINTPALQFPQMVIIQTYTPFFFFQFLSHLSDLLRRKICTTWVKWFASGLTHQRGDFFNIRFIQGLGNDTIRSISLPTHSKFFNTLDVCSATRLTYSLFSTTAEHTVLFSKKVCKNASALS